MTSGIFRVFAVLALSLSAIGYGDASSPGVSATSWQAWLGGLTKQGYSVTQGNTILVTNADCPMFEAVFGSCFGNNPAAPYIIPQPPVGGAYVDPYYATPFGGTGPTGRPTNLFYRLGDNDALVTLVTLPPQAAYLGYQTYMFTRNKSNYTRSNPAQQVSPDPSRLEIFGSLGNDVNNVIVKNQSGAAWNGATVVYVTTPNPNLRDALVAGARASGLDVRFMFSEPVGSNTIIGLSAAADDFVTLIRYALPENSQLGTDWTNNYNTNVLVYRVSNPFIPAARFGFPEYTPKMPSSESGLQASLNELSSLLQSWLASTSGGAATAVNMTLSDRVGARGQPYGVVGTDCIATGIVCAGDNQDTDAYQFLKLSNLASSQNVIITGVNHALTGNASYISLGIYNASNSTGVASASQTNPVAVGFNSGNLTGSAAAVLKSLGLYSSASASLKTNLPFLYVSLLSRTCTYAAAYCIDLNGTSLIPLTAPVSIIARAYIKPGTTTGADPNVMVNTKVILNSGSSILP